MNGVPIGTHRPPTRQSLGQRYLKREGQWSKWGLQAAVLAGWGLSSRPPPRHRGGPELACWSRNHGSPVPGLALGSAQARLRSGGRVGWRRDWRGRSTPGTWAVRGSQCPQGTGRIRGTSGKIHDEAPKHQHQPSDQSRPAAQGVEWGRAGIYHLCLPCPAPPVYRPGGWMAVPTRPRPPPPCSRQDSGGPWFVFCGCQAWAACSWLCP